MTLVEPLAQGWRIGVLTAGAPAMGAVLLLAIGTLVGARWSAFAVPARAMPVLVVAATLLGLAQAASPVPVHLALWMHPLAVAARALVASGLLAIAGVRLRRGASVTFAAIMLALYAALVTPVATDWMLGGVAGHAVSSIGMMLFVESIAGATALAMLARLGDLRFRQDMAKLMVAAALGLGYLGYMDYLILWFGNLPHKVGFYLERGSLGMGLLADAALLVGLALPIAALSLVGGERGRRIGGAGVLAGLFLFNLWWTGGGIVAAMVGAATAIGLALAGLALARRGEPAHG